MRNIKFPVAIISVLLFIINGCTIAGDIFKAGTWFGILSVVIIIVIVLLLIRAISKKS